MGQCISRDSDVVASYDNSRSLPDKATKLANNRKRKKLMQSSFARNARNDVMVETSKSTDSSESGHRAFKTGVVIIPEASDILYILQESSKSAFPGQNLSHKLAFNLSSPTYTEVTTFSTPAISERSETNVSTCPLTTDQLGIEHYENLVDFATSKADHSSLELLENERYDRSNDSYSYFDGETNRDLKSKSIMGKRKRTKGCVIKDCIHHVAADQDGTVSASFTPIKQTSLQSKVSVIQEEDVFEAPSDEESLHGTTIPHRMQREQSSKARASGPLTPVKLRTQWKTTPSSIQIRERAILLKNEATFSPLSNRVSMLQNHEDTRDHLNSSVDDSVLSIFQKLKLQVAVAAQEEKRNQKVAKLEDRIKDVQGYRDLWGDFQQIQKQLSIVEVEEKREFQCINVKKDSRNEVEYDLEDDVVTRVIRRKRRNSASLKHSKEEMMTESDSQQENASTVNVRNDLQNEVEYDLEDDVVTRVMPRNCTSTNLTHSKDEVIRDSNLQQENVSTVEGDGNNVWIFDFEAFDRDRKCDDDDSSQASLSLLSEKSMETQRRFFSQKRKNRKRKKKPEKNGVIRSKSTVIRRKSMDKAIESSTQSDYGPAHRLSRPSCSGSVDRYVGAYMNKNSPILNDMEVSFGTIGVGTGKNAIIDSDNCSMVSDLADDQSFSGSIAGTNSRNSGIWRASNDYRVNRRRQHCNTDRPVDIEKYIPSADRSVGSKSICSVAERREAVEARLKALTSKQQNCSEFCPASDLPSTVQTSALTQKFEEVVFTSKFTKEDEIVSSPFSKDNHRVEYEQSATLSVCLTIPMLDETKSMRLKRNADANIVCKCDQSELYNSAKGLDDGVVDKTLSGSTGTIGCVDKNNEDKGQESNNCFESEEHVFATKHTSLEIEHSATVTLLLAEEVSSKVEDVLSRFRSLTSPMHIDRQVADEIANQRGEIKHLDSR